MKTVKRPAVATAALAAVLLAAAPQALAAAGTEPGTTSVAASTVLPVETSDAEQAAAYLKQWMFDPNNPQHLLYAKSSFSGPSSKNTNLKNSLPRRFLQWEPQTFGINLGWTDDATATTAVRVSRWFFTRSDTTHPLRYGDTIALGYGVSPSYLRYADRLVGINLDWSSTPRYEWKLLGGPIGTLVRSGEWLSIYNTVTKQPLIYFDRTAGADIGWPNSETWGDQLQNAVMKFIRDHWREGLAWLLAQRL